jgi:hypothetical protein
MLEGVTLRINEDTPDPFIRDADISRVLIIHGEDVAETGVTALLLCVIFTHQMDVTFF